MTVVVRGIARTAVIVAAVVGLTAGCTDEAPDADGEGSRDPQIVDLIVMPDQLVSALESERAASIVEVVDLDLSAAIDTDLGGARAQVDEAVAALREALDGAGDRGVAYEPALGALDRLTEVRADVDARAGSIAVDDRQALRAVEAPYAEMTTATLDAAEATARDIDDSRLRRGAELYAAGVGQTAKEQELVRVLLLETVGGGLDDPASLAEAARLHGDMLSAQATVMDLAAGSDYADIAEQLRADLAAADLAEVTDTALETGVVDIQALLSAASTEPDVGWTGFLTRVEDTLRRSQD
jgi:hypothetical protein